MKQLRRAHRALRFPLFRRPSTSRWCFLWPAGRSSQRSRRARDLAQPAPIASVSSPRARAPPSWAIPRPPRLSLRERRWSPPPAHRRQGHFRQACGVLRQRSPGPAVRLHRGSEGFDKCIFRPRTGAVVTTGVLDIDEPLAAPSRQSARIGHFSTGERLLASPDRLPVLSTVSHSSPLLQPAFGYWIRDKPRYTHDQCRLRTADLVALRQ